MSISRTEEKYGVNGEKLKSLRKMKGLSLGRVSELTGISKSYLSIIERDIHRNLTLDILDKLANFFQVDVEYLVKRDEEEIEDTHITNQPRVTLKLEVELTRGQISERKLQQIIELIRSINEEY